MKRIFCDCCGKEMTYEGMGAVNGNKVSAALPNVRHIAVTIEFDIRQGNGMHTDICRDCRWSIIDSLDPRPKVEAEQLLPPLSTYSGIKL